MEISVLDTPTLEDAESFRTSRISQLEQEMSNVPETCGSYKKRSQEREQLKSAAPERIVAFLIRNRETAKAERLKRWQTAMGDRPRYEHCTLDSFNVVNDEQRKAVDKLRMFQNDMEDHIKKGTGLILSGPCGTGKDHLMFAMLRHLIVHLGADIEVNRYSGPQLAVDAKNFQDRMRIRNDETRLLCISDPVLPGGEAMYYYEQLLYRLIDCQYNHCWPIWMTMNAANRTEMNAMIGPALADRVLDGAVIVHCSWPSYRKAL